MNKKRVLVPLIIAIILMGIGYAIASQSLTINGSASAAVDDTNFSVIFNKDVAATATLSETITGATATASYDDSNSQVASLSVSGLTTKGQYATFTYSIINKSADLGATVTVGEITNSNSDYFTVTTSLASSSLTANEGTTTLTVIVTLNKTPIAEQSATITVPITAEAVAE